MEHWINQAVIYHIYPLGFCGCPEYNPGGSPVPRLDKLQDWIPHLKDLGVNTLYLGPVWQSVKHGYDTVDYYQLDCRLGDNDHFSVLCDTLHQNGFRVVLDGVFHHVGRDFWAFRDVRERGSDSPYCSWFQNLNFGSSSPMGDPFWYESWGGHYELVKLNLQNQEVRDHLLGAVGMWMDRFHIDGLRLDAADCVDTSFFHTLRSYTKSRDPEFWLMGEIIHGDYTRWANSELLDSVTNYECWKGIWSAHNTKNYFEIAHSLHRQFGPGGIYRGLPLYNFTENHDVDRLASTLANPRHLFHAYTLLYTMPGVPSLYYGGEWAVEGKRTEWSDVDLRPCLELSEMASRDQALCRHLMRLAELRAAFPALRVGDYENIVIKNQQLVFRRATSEQRVYVLLNLAEQEATLEFSHNEPVLQDVLHRDQVYQNDGGRTWLTMPPCSSMVLVGAPNQFIWQGSPSHHQAPSTPMPSLQADFHSQAGLSIPAEKAIFSPSPPQVPSPPAARKRGNVLVLLAHPRKESLDAALADAAVDTLRKNGYGVWFHDLYAEGFDPVLPPEERADFAPPALQKHQREVCTADGVIVVHPNWWGQPPAILSGWIDRVLRKDIAYTLEAGGVPTGRLKARAAIVFNTSSLPAQQEAALLSDPLQLLWRDYVFGRCGIHIFDRCIFRTTPQSTPQQRLGWLDEVRSMVAAYFPKS